MKIKHLIIILSLLLAYVSMRAQSPKILVADETYFTQSITSFKITTSNDSIRSLLIKQFSDRPTKVSASLRKDRFGDYYEYVFTYKQEAYSRMVDFLNKLNGRK